MLTEILTILLVVAAWIWYKGRNPENSRFPKGPFVFPVVGTLPHFRTGVLPLLLSWKKEYGKFVGLKFGSFRAVLINDYDLIKEAFSMKEFSGRPSLPPLIAVGKGAKRGLVPSEGAVWEEQRRFSLRHLRDFGFGKKSMEGVMHDSAEDIIKSFLKENGQPVNTVRKFSLAVMSALWLIVAGEKLDFDDKKFQDQLDTLNGFIESVNPSNLGLVIPWTIKVAPGLVGWNQFLHAVGKLHTFMGSHIENHKKTFQEDNIRDFMDLYLSKIKETTDPSSSFYKEEGDINMLVACINLFVAGSETTNMTINWALLFLVLNTDVQAKLFKEIENVVGTSRLPSLEDRTKMPYTEAVMMETLRLSSIVPLGIFRNTMEDVEFHGHFIPKDTMVMANLYGQHHDQDIWGKDVEEFRPERFLDSNGKLLKDHPHIIPFSIGKRVCLGETLARAEFFVFLSSLSQRFEFSLDSASGKPDMTGMKFLFRSLPPFKLIFKDRQAI